MTDRTDNSQPQTAADWFADGEDLRNRQFVRAVDAELDQQLVVGEKALLYKRGLVAVAIFFLVVVALNLTLLYHWYFYGEISFIATLVEKTPTKKETVRVGEQEVKLPADRSVFVSEKKSPDAGSPDQSPPDLSPDSKLSGKPDPAADKDENEDDEDDPDDEDDEDDEEE